MKLFSRNTIHSIDIGSVDQVGFRSEGGGGGDWNELQAKERVRSDYGRAILMLRCGGKNIIQLFILSALRTPLNGPRSASKAPALREITVS